MGIRSTCSYIVSYDIPNNTKAYPCPSCIDRIGTWVQSSVLECFLNRKQRVLFGGTIAQRDSPEGRYRQDLWFVWSLCPQGRVLGTGDAEGGHDLPTMIDVLSKKTARHEVVEFRSSVPRKPEAKEPRSASRAA